MEKSPEAFRTISEVADWLGVPTHVLRFWESRFSQVKPVKRAGGRRYYRPADMLLLGGIKRLLHDDGMTIRGVQKLLREEGVKHVAGFSQPLDSDDMIDVTPEDDAAEVPASPIALDVDGRVVTAVPNRQIQIRRCPAECDIGRARAFDGADTVGRQRDAPSGPRVGGMDGHRRADIHGKRWLAGRKGDEDLIDSVVGKLRFEARLRATCMFGVEAMDGRLVCLTSSPHRER